MSETKKPEPDTLAKSPRDGVTGKVRQNAEGGLRRPGTEAEEREAVAGRAGQTETEESGGRKG